MIHIERVSSITTKNNAIVENSQSRKKFCCFFWKYGKCEPPRGSCRFLHDKPDDGVTPCCFGATCRLGHANRVLTEKMNTKSKLQYWKEYNKNEYWFEKSDWVHGGEADTPSLPEGTCQELLVIRVAEEGKEHTVFID